MSSSSSEQGSSSSSGGNIFLDNVELLRQYSLDPDLIELYFNKGVFAQEIDLDDAPPPENHSSSSSGFSLMIEIRQLARNPFGGSYVLPEDLQLYIYDEEVDGTAVPGILEAAKIAGINSVAVGVSGIALEDGQEVSFQINIEHPSISSIRRIFRFRNQKDYTHAVDVRPPIVEENRRIDASYASYLLGWIEDFWSGYDASDPSLVPAFVSPPDSPYFFPLEHARWKVSKELVGSLDLRVAAGPALTPGNTGAVSGWNFLGIPPEIWRCINTPNEDGEMLYKNIPRQISVPDDFGDWVGKDIGDLLTSDQDFDCRSFTAASMFFLRSQLSQLCPGVEIQSQAVVNRNIRKSHEIVLVKMPGDPKPCCEGSFLFEPQTGTTYDKLYDPEGKKGYCDKFPEYCADGFGDWVSREPGKEYENTGVSIFRNPDWEKAPAQVERISNVVCGCMEGDHPDGSAEKMIQSKCEDGTFGDWFKDNFAYEPDRVNSPMTDMPQILSCDRVSCTDPSEEGQSPCQPDEGGSEPYVCELTCVKRWICLIEECLPSWSTEEIGEGEYKVEQECITACKCPPGYRKVESTTEMLSANSFTCEPDCNFPEHSCGELCCEDNLFDTGNSCQPCPEKPRTLRFQD